MFLRILYLLLKQNYEDYFIKRHVLRQAINFQVRKFFTFYKNLLLNVIFFFKKRIKYIVNYIFN